MKEDRRALSRDGAVIAACCVLVLTSAAVHGCAESVEAVDDGSTAGGDGEGGAGGLASSGGSTSDGGTGDTGPSSASSTASSSSSVAASSSSGGPACGNGSCEANESCNSCPADCGSCCGDGVCDEIGQGETCQSCPADCGALCCPAPSPGDPNGPAIYVFANYDGGQFTIHVDSTDPQIVIGLVSYEAMQVTIIGPNVGNVVAVHYAGYDDLPGSTVTGVDASLVEIAQSPAATLSDPSGNGSIVCNYQQGCGDQGGCNTAAQIADYFVDTLGGAIASHTCQYGAYSGTLTTSAIATCN